MLETVERISNISKCRDLINFELLLYRISIFIFWDKKLNLNKKINFIIIERIKIGMLIVGDRIRPKLFSVLFLNPRSRLLKMYLLWFEIGIYPDLLNCFRTNNSSIFFYLQRGRIVWTESLLKGLIYEIRNEIYYR